MILFDAIAGSHVYGLATEDSDLDKRGVFLEDFKSVLLGKTRSQMSIDGDDQTYYEIKTFLDFIRVQNPNAIELLFTPKEFILEQHEILTPIFNNPHQFLTKNIIKTFGGFAKNQIKKARGESKMIAKPPVEEKDAFDFMWILKGYNSYPLKEYFNDLNELNVAIAKVSHTRDLYVMYALDEYHEEFGNIRLDDDERLLLSSVPKSMVDTTTQIHLIYNVDEYSKHKKRHQEYLDWKEKVNTKRYVLEADNKRKYNAKNLMHAMRILYMMEDFTLTNTLRIKVPQSRRDWLLSVKNAEVDYQDIVDESERLWGVIENSNISLPNEFLGDMSLDNLIVDARLLQLQ